MALIFPGLAEVVVHPEPILSVVNVLSIPVTMT